MKKVLFTEISTDPDNLFTKLYSWRSPERYWTPKSRGWYVGYSLLFVIIIAIGVILKEPIFVLAIISFSFLWFVQGTIPPEIAEHTITTIGIRTYHKLYRWKSIKSFWFSEKNNLVYLNLDVQEDEKKEFTTRVSLIIEENGADKDIFKSLIRFLEYGEKEEIGFNFLTRLTHGIYFDVTKYLEENTATNSDTF